MSGIFPIRSIDEMNDCTVVLSSDNRRVQQKAAPDTLAYRESGFLLITTYDHKFSSAVRLSHGEMDGSDVHTVARRRSLDLFQRAAAV